MDYILLLNDALKIKINKKDISFKNVSFSYNETKILYIKRGAIWNNV